MGNACRGRDRWAGPGARTHEGRTTEPRRPRRWERNLLCPGASPAWEACLGPFKAPSPCPPPPGDRPGHPGPDIWRLPTWELKIAAGGYSRPVLPCHLARIFPGPADLPHPLLSDPAPPQPAAPDLPGASAAPSPCALEVGRGLLGPETPVPKLRRGRRPGARGACLPGISGEAWPRGRARSPRCQISKPRERGGAWLPGVCGLLANGCCEGRGPWGQRGLFGSLPPARFRQIPRSPAALWILGPRQWVPPGSPSARRSRTPGAPAPFARQARAADLAVASLLTAVPAHRVPKTRCRRASSRSARK